MDKLQDRARRARDQAEKEKLQLLDNAWKSEEGNASDKAMQRIRQAQEQLDSDTLAAADQGKDEVTLLRLSFQSIDLRHALQQELHASPDRYPILRKQGPPSFKLIEQWLTKDLKVEQWEKICPMPWLWRLYEWMKRGTVGKMLVGKPRLPQPLTALWSECLKRKLSPRYEYYKVREDEGVAVIVRWSPSLTMRRR